MSDHALLPGECCRPDPRARDDIPSRDGDGADAGLPILLLFCAISIGYGESATAARCQSPSDTMRK
jgi:hypothetical protein